jgi:hypothetical protein
VSLDAKSTNRQGFVRNGNLDVIFLYTYLTFSSDISFASAEDKKVDFELTVPQVLADPMIAQINKADGINERSFAQLLESAARLRSRVSALPGLNDASVLPPHIDSHCAH